MRLTKRGLISIAALAAVGLLGTAGIASAHGGFGWWGAPATPEQIAQQQQSMFQQKTDVLGLSVEEVKNAWAQGKTLQQLASEKGMTDQQLQDKLKQLHEQNMKDQLQGLVNQGVITQQQADDRLKFLQSQQTTKTHRGHGGHHMGGMGMGWH